MRFFNNPMAFMLILYMAVQSFLSGEIFDPQAWRTKLIMLPAILIGLSFHEFAHAKVADLLGDNTPRNQRRVTINPVSHIDLIGFIALLFIGFGWGKPVQINPRNFKSMRRDELLVSVAGVTMNLVLAFIFAGILKLLYTSQFDINPDLGLILIQMIKYVIYINIVLMIFNLLPIPPLDGFGIITEIFNLKRKEIYYQIYDKGFIILMLLIIFNITDKILFPAVNFVFDFILDLFF